MEIQLKVGQTVRLRSGVIDKVCGHDPSLAGTGLEFQLEEGGRHWANGRWIRSEESGADIVEIISEPADCVTKELRELRARIARLEGQSESSGPEFKRGDRVMVRDCATAPWLRRYYIEPTVSISSPHLVSMTADDDKWSGAQPTDRCASFAFCRHPTPDELENY